jgi:hypothetical protein
MQISIDTRKEKLLENFARFGIISKGVVYCLIGLLSLLTALGIDNKKADKTEAIKLIYEQPLGKFLLIIIGIGLLGYVTWRLYQSVGDSERKGKDAKGIAQRLGFIISAVIYLSLAIYALKVAFSGLGNDNGDSKKFILSKILTYDVGPWLVGIGGLIVIGTGVYQIYKGVTKKFMKKVVLAHNNKKSLFTNAGVIGYVARGIVLGIIGYFVVLAAMHANASEAQGTNQAFQFLENEFGSVLMGLVAAGLVAYGIFMFVRAKYEILHLEK